MLSYQHGYHAGNFADVMKHTSLTRLLNYLTQKEKPLFFLETHSGKGLYDLSTKQAEKTGEYRQGIQLIWPERKKLPPVFNEYLQIIHLLNDTQTLKYYPGSPLFAIHQLRSHDRLYFCELHPKEFATLEHLPCLNKKVHFSETDGIKSMKALIPPFEKRGLIFIDPSYEIKEEYRDLPLAIKQAYDRFSTGVFCLWYPVVNRKYVEKLNRGMKAINAKSSLHIEFNLTLAPTDGMSGTGLWILNPPYNFAEEMKSVLDTLRNYFNPGISSYHIEAH